jgi:hypothetical protein
MSKLLTADLILQKTKASNLESVKNLNLWGNDIDDVRIVREMANLEVLSLSVNRINSLKAFQHCKKLSELYLRKNLISDLSELKYLQNLPNLKVLWLWDNPCAELARYRETVLAYLPNLVKLDNQVVTTEEKQSASKIEIPRNRSGPNEENTKKEELKREKDSNVAKEPSSRLHRVKRENSVTNRNENILTAILALIRELDENKLELVKKEIEKKLGDRV